MDSDWMSDELPVIPYSSVMQGPKNIFSPFVVRVGRKRYASFFPTILWSCSGAKVSKILCKEVEDLRTKANTLPSAPEQTAWVEMATDPRWTKPLNWPSEHASQPHGLGKHPPVESASFGEHTVCANKLSNFPALPAGPHTYHMHHQHVWSSDYSNIFSIPSLLSKDSAKGPTANEEATPLPCDSQMPLPQMETTSHIARNHAASNKSQQRAAKSPYCLRRLIWYKIAGPYILQFLRRRALPSPDILFYMESYFGHCLIDRTGTLSRSVPAKVLSPIPAFEPCFDKPISQICLERAREIISCARVHNTNIIVLWGGGTCSTAALCALLSVTKETIRDFIYVIYTKECAKSYPWFIDILKNIVPLVVDTEADLLLDNNDTTEPKPIVVTGNLGNQVFGSMYWKCFSSLSMARHKEGLHKSAFASWKDVLPLLLIELGVLPDCAKEAWLDWITPQVEKSPVPIVTAMDMFWWINFSLRWQNFQLSDTVNKKYINSDVVERTFNFFDSTDFQQWSLHNYHVKQRMMKHWNWEMYQGVLREFIFGFCGNSNCYNFISSEVDLNLPCLKPTNSVIAVDEDLHTISFGNKSVCIDHLKWKYPDGIHLPDETLINPGQVACGTHWSSSAISDSNINDIICKPPRMWTSKKGTKQHSRFSPEFSHLLKLWAFYRTNTCGRDITIGTFFRHEPKDELPSLEHTEINIGKTVSVAADGISAFSEIVSAISAL